MPNEKSLHLKIVPGDVCPLAILPSSYEWVDYLAQFLKDPKGVAWYREFKTVNGLIGRVPVTICSTGNGGQSTAIAVEELYRSGTRGFIRVGTSSALVDGLEEGDLVMVQGASTNDGVVAQYIPSEYPAISDYGTLSSLVETASHLHLPYHVGTVTSPATRFHLPPSCGDLCVDLNSATLFAVSSALHVASGCVLQIVSSSVETDYPPAGNAIQVLWKMLEGN